MRKRPSRRRYERYELARSPLAQRPTQRELAQLLGYTRDDLRRLANYREQFIVRRQETVGKKVRDSAYPVSWLRGVHEKLKYHLNKVKQRDYVFSPRKGRGQRDNALFHLDQEQYLTLDLKQFYPSTTSSMTRTFFVRDCRMYEDVAGLLTTLVTIDGKVSFGSPLTPVLCTLIHRNMFDRIADLCAERGLRYSTWVDDLTISGRFVPGRLLNDIRNIVREHGLRTHKIEYRAGNRPVFITGIGVVGRHLVAPNTLHLRIRDHWENFHSAVTLDEAEYAAQRLLSSLGTLRQIVGSKSLAGMRAADSMNVVRQKIQKRRRLVVREASPPRRTAVAGGRQILEDETPPWEAEQPSEGAS